MLIEKKISFNVLLIDVFLLFIPACIHRSQVYKKTVYINFEKKIESQTTINKAPPITIWIHGTRFFCHKTFYSLFDGKAQLKLAKSVKTSNYLYSVAENISKAAPQQFPLDTFYILGWSGKLDAHERERVAQVLYNDLQFVKQEYIQKYGVVPVIQIITHSHGGNIALNLAKIKQSINDNVVIDLLVLLACPVQKRTSDYILDPLFKKVYSLYSGMDMIQVLALDRSYFVSYKNQEVKTKKYTIPRFALRRFPFQLNHIIQAKIRINDHAICHTDFTSEKFIVILPTILKQLDSWHMQEQNFPITMKQKNKLLCIHDTKKLYIQHM